MFDDCTDARRGDFKMKLQANNVAADLECLVLTDIIPC